MGGEQGADVSRQVDLGDDADAARAGVRDHVADVVGRVGEGAVGDAVRRIVLAREGGRRPRGAVADQLRQAGKVDAPPLVVREMPVEGVVAQVLAVDITFIDKVAYDIDDLTN